MLLPFTRAHHTEAEAVARILTAVHDVTVTTFKCPENTRFDVCEFCEYEPERPAPLEWWWERPDATSNGNARTCTLLACALKVVEIAVRESGDISSVTCEHPVLPAPAQAAVKAVEAA